jgi:nitrate/TMAO reductase-like tetraheme cytochrome c subunit
MLEACKVMLSTVLLTALASAAAAAETDSLPVPHGWIGTTDQWARGLGIAFTLLAMGLLALGWWRMRRVGLPEMRKELFLLPLVVLPAAIVFLGYSHGIESSKHVEFCGSCHVMEPYLADLRNPDSDTLAATHYKNGYILDHQCYTCHSDYGMFGTMQAKMAGMGHVARHLTGAYHFPLKVAKPYSNLRCLACHEKSQKFRNSEGHPKEDRAKLLSGETSCIECHGPPHPEAAKEGPK